MVVRTFTLMSTFIRALHQEIRNCATTVITAVPYARDRIRLVRFRVIRVRSTAGIERGYSGNPGAAEDLCRAFVLFSSRR